MILFAHFKPLEFHNFSGVNNYLAPLTINALSLSGTTSSGTTSSATRIFVIIGKVAGIQGLIIKPENQLRPDL